MLTYILGKKTSKFEDDSCTSFTRMDSVETDGPRPAGHLVRYIIILYNVIIMYTISNIILNVTVVENSFKYMLHACIHFQIQASPIGELTNVGNVTPTSPTTPTSKAAGSQGMHINLAACS